MVQNKSKSKYPDKPHYFTTLLEICPDVVPKRGYVWRNPDVKYGNPTINIALLTPHEQYHISVKVT
jgi:hypothetical protein